jgi:hypothetical protein
MLRSRCLAVIFAATSFGVWATQSASTHAGTINGNIIATVSDADHKDFEVTVTSDSNYGVDKGIDPKVVRTTNLRVGAGASIAPDKIPDPGKMVTVTWTTKISKGDNVGGLVIGTTEATLGKVTYAAKFTDDTPVPDLGWQEDASGNLSLANGDASDIDFTKLAFFVQPSGVLTSQEVDAFISGTLPLTPGMVSSGDVTAGGSLFVGSFPPSAAILASFTASYVDMGFSPVTANDGLITAFDIVVPEPPSLALMVCALMLMGFASAIRLKRK